MTAAIVVRQTGGPEVLVPDEISVSDPGPGEVRIAVAAAGVNFIDIYRRSGLYAVPLPAVPGHEGAGTVSAVGPDVTEFAVGDRVAWADVPASYAAELVAPAGKLLPVPEGIGDAEAAAIPLQGLTAHYLATDSYPIKPGDTVLVHAGAGGVGLVLTQIAKIKGARVITTVSNPDKGELSRAAGADEILVGYDDFATKVRALTGGLGVQAVYDGVGRDTFDGSLDSVARRGFLVLFGAASGPVPPFDPQRLGRAGSLSLTRPTLGDFTSGREELLGRSKELFSWIAGGRLKISVGGRYPLAHAASAHSDLAARLTTGKLLLVP